MLESKDDNSIREDRGDIGCYYCGSKIANANLKNCYNCNTILNPNDLKWRYSFLYFLCLLCLIPILIAIFSSLLSYL